MKQQGFFQVLFVVVILTACGQLTNTIYVPAITQMAADLGVESIRIQAVMAVYLIAYGFSQFFYGPLSDQYGRKPLMLIGLMIFVLGSLTASLAQNFTLLVLGSFIQGLGTGVGGVMCRTIMRDLYSGLHLQRANSYVSMALIFSPLLAPILGGLIGTALGWQANFWFLTGFGLLVWLVVFRLFRETGPCQSQPRLSAMASYRHVLSHSAFNGFLVILIATFAGVSVFEAAAGVLFGDLMGLDPRLVSLLFVLPIPGYLAGSWLAGRLACHYGLVQILGLGTVMLALGSVSMLLAGLLGYLNVLVVLLPAVLYFVGGGLIFPTATTAALEPLPGNAGVAGALLGGMQNLGAGVVTLVSASLPMHSQVPVGLVLSLMTLLVAMVFLLQFLPALARSPAPAR